MGIVHGRFLGVSTGVNGDNLFWRFSARRAGPLKQRPPPEEKQLCDPVTMDVLMEDLMGDLDDLIVDGEKITFEHLLKLELADI